MDVRKGDTVLVLAGKDRGKRGTVERVERTKRGFGVVVRASTWPGATSGAVANADGGHPRHPGADPHQQRAGGLPALQPADAGRPRRLEGEHARSTRLCKNCGEQIEGKSK
jgi:hypothetical protein